MDGAIVVDKPEGWTSHDVVNKVRRFAGTRRVGHLGTLDPMATGVLPLLIGRATRLSQFLMKGDKEYLAVIRFGYATTTYDRQGEPLTAPAGVTLDVEQIEALAAQFRGVIQQVPPAVSAKKIGGIPAYKLARKQKAVTLEPVQVTVYEFEIQDWSPPDLSIRVRCSAGTYVRSIAHDLGQAAGCGAFLQALRRTQSGAFVVAQANDLTKLQEFVETGTFDAAMTPMSSLLPEMPAEYVDDITAAQIRQGRAFRVSPFNARGDAHLIKAVGPDGDLIAIGEARLPNVYHPILVM